MEIFKRLINTISILFFILMMVLAFTEPIEIPRELRFIPILIFALYFGLIALINYIIFGYFTIWHENIGKEEVSKINSLKEEHSFKLAFYTGFHDENIWLHGLLNIVRGLVNVTCIVIFIVIITYLVDLVGITKLSSEWFGYNPDKYAKLEDFIAWINISYTFNFISLYIIGLWFRFYDASSIFSWIDSFEKKIHTPHLKKLKTFRNNFQFDSWFIDEDDWLDEDD